MPEKQRPSASANRQRAHTSVSTAPILAGLPRIEKDFLLDLASACREAAETDNAAVIATVFNLLERAPLQLAVLRHHRSSLARQL